MLSTTFKDTIIGHVGFILAYNRSFVKDFTIMVVNFKEILLTLNTGMRYNGFDFVNRVWPRAWLRCARSVASAH